MKCVHDVKLPKYILSVHCLSIIIEVSQSGKAKAITDLYLGTNTTVIENTDCVNNLALHNKLLKT